MDGFAETGRVTDAGHPASDEHNNQNTMLATEAITGITFFAAAFGTVYVVVNARHRQRMAMIEKGMDPNAGARPQTLRSLRSGMLLLGFGLRHFSMHPATLLAVKQRVLTTSLPDIAPLVARVLKGEEPDKIRQVLEKLNA